MQVIVLFSLDKWITTDVSTLHTKPFAGEGCFHEGTIDKTLFSIRNDGAFHPKLQRGCVKEHSYCWPP